MLYQMHAVIFGKLGSGMLVLVPKLGVGCFCISLEGWLVLLFIWWLLIVVCVCVEGGPLKRKRGNNYINTGSC